MGPAVQKRENAKTRKRASVTVGPRDHTRPPRSTTARDDTAREHTLCGHPKHRHCAHSRALNFDDCVLTSLCRLPTARRRRHTPAARIARVHAHTRNCGVPARASYSSFSRCGPILCISAEVRYTVLIDSRLRTSSNLGLLFFRMQRLIATTNYNSCEPRHGVHERAHACDMLRAPTHTLLPPHALCESEISAV